MRRVGNQPSLERRRDSVIREEEQIGRETTKGPAPNSRGGVKGVLTAGKILALVSPQTSLQ